MARTWGATRAKFWDVTGAWPGTSPLEINGSEYLETVVDNSVTWTRLISQIGQGAAQFLAVDGWDDWLTTGRVCVIEKVTNHTTGGARLLACFIIEDIEPKVSGGVNVIDVRGPGVESQLTKQLLWAPIGNAVTTTTHLAVTAGGPDDREMAVGAPAGNDSLLLDTSNSDDVGQEIRIQLDGGGTHITYVTERVSYEGQFHLKIADRLPVAASAGNDVEIWTRRIRVDDPGLFVADVQVTVDLDAAGQTLDTFATGELDTTNRVTLRDGLPSVASENNEVLVTNPFAPTTSDVAQILAQAPGWTAVYQTGTGTAQGSAHRPQGESAFDLLSTLSQRTGEFFRQRVLTNPNTPHKSIEWRRTADSSGVTLVMYPANDYTEQTADEMSLTKGAIFSLSRKRSLPLITRVFPSAGDQVISLAHCSAGAISYAASLGCSVVTGYGLYEPDYVQHDAGYAAYGAHEVRQTYGDISITDAKNMVALIAACDQLLLSAVQTLVTAQAREYYTIDCYVPNPLMPGQTVKIDNDTRTVPNVSTAGDWTILEVTERLVNGRPRTTLSVSNMSGLRWTPAGQFAQRLRSVIQSQRRVGGGGASTSSTIIASGDGGGATDHGALTGLADVEDHPGYLLVSGGRPLAGNMAVNSGITIDGVDLSAHAANADAHHARVTAADASITVNSQAIRVSDGFAGAGLALNGGVASVNTATAQGTGTSGDVVAVAPSATGGLQNTAAGVGVKLPTNSGLVADSSGLALGTPATLSATSTNALTGGTQSHAITATDNAKTTPGQLLKGSAAGDLTLRYGIADKVTAPLIDTSSGGLRLDPANGVTTNDGNLSFVGARQIDTDTGSLTLSPAQTLVLSPDDNVAQLGPTTTLKTAHWASGFLGTGWGVTYDGNGDFRTLYADELHVAAFIADTARVAVGAEYITPSMALIARPFTIPAVNGTGTLYVEDAPGMDDTAVFAENDWVLLRIISRAGGGLIVANVWGQVTGYQDRADGQQSWVFTTRSTTAAGQTAQTGAVALDFGKSGDGWWWVTTLDEAGSPYAGITTWSGANPYDEGNRVHRLRIGQLKGVSGAYEWGLQAGTGSASFVRFSDLRSEIHGTRLSLYAGDGGRMQVSAVDVLFYRTGSASSTLVPDADGAAINVETTGASYFSVVNEGANAPNHNTYIANTPNMSGAVFLSLSNPAAFTSIFRVDIKAALRSTGLTNDTVSIYGQVFALDLITPLTGEVLLATRTANTTATVTVTAPHEGYGTATAADWNGARLRLRWEYQINANEEAIRLDPSIPSLAVGNPLPTGPTTGGNGLWVGVDAGFYKLRLGTPGGVGFHWTGTAVELRNSTGAPTITLDASGNSRFDGAMTIGAAGGIWQGTGTFAAPTTGLKIYNSGGVGRLSTYNGGLEQITINTAGQLAVGQGKVLLDREGLSFSTISTYQAASALKFLDAAGRVYGKLYGYDAAFNDSMELSVTSPDGTNSSVVLTSANGNATTRIVAGGASVSLSLGLSGYTSFDMIGVDELAAAGTVAKLGHARIADGLAVGSTTVTPDTGAMYLHARTSTVTPYTTGAIVWAQTVSGVQKLYVKFGNGTVRELASA